MNNSSFENDLDIAIAKTDLKKDHIYSVYVYSNIDNARQNLILKLLSAINNMKKIVDLLNNMIVVVISYCNKNHLVLLNN